MSRKKQLGRIWDRIYVGAANKYRALNQAKIAQKKLKVIHGGRAISSEEYNRIKAFWKPFGIKPKKYWFKLFCSGKDTVDPRYIPGSMWEGMILPYFNNVLWGRSYADKCAYDMLFPELIRPRTIIKNSCGRFYDGNQNVISKEKAIELCLKEKSFIVKYAIFSHGGKNIQVLDSDSINRESITKLLNEYRFNFIIQEVVEQHEDLAKLNASSLNTIRTISFFFKGEVYILSSQLRIGGNGSRVDNYSSGGYSCNICPDGRLSEFAISSTGPTDKHPNGFYFKDFVIPSFDKVIKTIKEEAPKIPHLGIIGWDFAIGKNGEPVFIELNVFPGQNQRGSGPSFGDLTEDVLKDVFIDQTLKNAFI